MPIQTQEWYLRLTVHKLKSIGEHFMSLEVFKISWKVAQVGMLSRLQEGLSQRTQLKLACFTIFPLSQSLTVMVVVLDAKVVLLLAQTFWYQF